MCHLPNNRLLKCLILTLSVLMLNEIHLECGKETHSNHMLIKTLTKKGHMTIFNNLQNKQILDMNLSYRA